MSLEHADVTIIHLNDVPEQYFGELPPLRDYQTEPLPFFLVLPSGIQHLDEIRASIANHGLSVRREAEVNNFELMGRYIYPVVAEKPHSYAWLMLNRHLFGTHADFAYAFVLNDPVNSQDAHEALARIKREIRAEIGIRRYTIINGLASIDVALHHIHAPDYDDLAFQYNALLNFTER